MARPHPASFPCQEGHRCSLSKLQRQPKLGVGGGRWGGRWGGRDSAPWVPLATGSSLCKEPPLPWDRGSHGDPWASQWQEWFCETIHEFVTTRIFPSIG